MAFLLLRLIADSIRSAWFLDDARARAAEGGGGNAVCWLDRGEGVLYTAKELGDRLSGLGNMVPGDIVVAALVGVPP